MVSHRSSEHAGSRRGLVAAADLVDHLRRRGSSRCGTACTCRTTRSAQNSMAKRAMRGHVDGVVEHHDAAVADHARRRRRRPRSRAAVSNCGRRQVGAERAAHLRRRGPAGRRAVPPPKSSISSPSGHAEGESRRGRRCLMLPASWNGMVPRRAARCRSRRRTARPSARIIGHRGQRQHVVDHGRPAEQAVDGAQRRLGADHAALALEALEQRGLFAADVGAGADAHLRRRRPSPLPSTAAARASRRLRRARRWRASSAAMACRVLGAQCRRSPRRADREAGDRHALDQRERVALHQHAVGEGAAVALVGVAARCTSGRPRPRRRSAT